MKYFNRINDLEQAKLQYRKLAKQLHPDAGGTAHEFQKLQDEYKTTVERIHKCNAEVSFSKPQSSENELLNELGDLAKTLIKKQVPQTFLRNKIHTADSKLKKNLYSDIINFLDGLYD